MMAYEAVLAGLVAAVAVLLVAVRTRGSGIAAALLAGATLTCTIAAGWGWQAWALGPATRRALERDARPAARRDDGYVSSDTCRACHPGPYASWQASYHRTMTQPARPDTVLAAIPEGGVDLPLGGVTWHLERRDEGFVVRRLGTGGRAAAKPLVMTTGSHHMQVYWMPGAAGRELRLLPWAWLRETGRWVPVDHSFLRPPDEPTTQSVWNLNCVSCHSTGGQPGQDPWTEVLQTRAAELGIACEACHGPAGEHLARQRTLARYGAHLAEVPDDSMVQPARLDPARSVQVCGQCHGIHGDAAPEEDEAWLQHGYSYRPGQDLSRTRTLLLPGRIRGHSTFPGEDTPESSPPAEGKSRMSPYSALASQFWPDGMVRVTGREANALAATACNKRGELSCLSCHSMHGYAEADDQLAPDKIGDAACVQCHQNFTAGRDGHTRHAADSDGSRCMNCHMPHTVYGLLKAVRSHHIDSPRVTDSLGTGRPNACNLCHLDRSLGWTQEHLAAWYEQPVVDLDPAQRDLSAAVVWMLSGDAAQRALVAWSAGWEPARRASSCGGPGGDWVAPHLARLLNDPYAAVRFIARRSLGACEGFKNLPYDYTAPAKNLERAVEDALGTWMLLRLEAGPPRRTGPELLLDASGRPDAARVEALRALRDDRPVEIRE